MADHKQQQEFLGGGPKFNTVGKDTRGPGEPPVVANRAGLGRVALIVVVVVLLAGGLIYFAWNDQTPGKTSGQPMRGGQGVAPDAKASPTSDPNLK